LRQIEEDAVTIRDALITERKLHDLEQAERDNLMQARISEKNNRSNKNIKDSEQNAKEAAGAVKKKNMPASASGGTSSVQAKRAGQIPLKKTVKKTAAARRKK